MVFLIGAGARRGQPLSYDGWCAFRHCAQRAGIRQPWVTPHTLRHTHATKMWEAGIGSWLYSGGWGMPAPSPRAAIPGCRIPAWSASTGPRWASTETTRGLAEPSTPGPDVGHVDEKVFAAYLADMSVAAVWRQKQAAPDERFAARWPVLPDWFAEPLSIRVGTAQGSS